MFEWSLFALQSSFKSHSGKSFEDCAGYTAIVDCECTEKAAVFSINLEINSKQRKSCTFVTLSYYTLFYFSILTS